MARVVISSSLIFGAAILVGFLTINAFGQDEFKISGKVVDRRGKPIPNINVMLRQGLVGFASGETAKDGTYTVSYSRRGLFDAM